MEPSAPVLSSPSLILLLRVVLQLVNAPTGLIQRESLLAATRILAAPHAREGQRLGSQKFFAI